MSISRFFTTVFSIKRSVWGTDEDDNSFSEESEVGSFSGHRQQASAELVQNLGLTYTKAFTVWCPVGTDVVEGDTIEAEDGKYSVRAVQLNGNGLNRHKQIVAELDLVETE